MTTALLVSVGTTADPILKAVEELRAEDQDVVAYILYGRPFPGQHPSPFDVVVAVRQQALTLGVRTETREVADPEDIDVCLEAARSALCEAASAPRVVVNYTGGTKALSAAMVHVALTEPLQCELVLDYTGSILRDAHGRVIREAMRVKRSGRTVTEDLIRQALEQVRKSAYREAQAIARRLPEEGRAGFLRRGVDALCAWDEFDYEAATKMLRRLYEPAKAIRDIPEIGGVASLMVRLLEPGNLLAELVQRLRNRSGVQRAQMALIVADTLENAARRLAEGRFTDAALRAYRAVECAVHGALLGRGVDPWEPRWDLLKAREREEYCRRLRLCAATDLPTTLSLYNGLRLAEVLDSRDLPEELGKHLRDLQLIRNHSYLEHGYNRVTQTDAERALTYASELAGYVLGVGLSEERERVRHAFG